MMRRDTSDHCGLEQIARALLVLLQRVKSLEVVTPLLTTRNELNKLKNSS